MDAESRYELKLVNSLKPLVRTTNCSSPFFHRFSSIKHSVSAKYLETGHIHEWLDIHMLKEKQNNAI